MNEELTRIKEEMNAQKAVYIEKMQAIFQEQVKKIFDEFPKLKRFTVDVNNHEFNDGDATYFAIYAEEPTINGTDDANDTEESELTEEEFEIISDRIEETFDAFDGEDLETMYGDAYGSIGFSRDEQ